ncbi:DUF6002 family protein [Streptomyces sp. B1I3]|uniref:DUF6002 family protein n=1 Tax=Streptomyces sp. B1I3 TaxID=3042264 RepID=UPI0027D80D21|nr:DUF6002 family protein [Streptomyces sp. B1I3]
MRPTAHSIHRRSTLISDVLHRGDVLTKYEDRLRRALSQVGRSSRSSSEFTPPFELPAPSSSLSEFFAVAGPHFAELGTVGRTRLVLLDLMGNPATRTVKTLASLVIVARAVLHTERTGEPVMIVTPSSANKATALRDAVLRAYRTGLSDPDGLRIVTVVPEAARPKLWSSALSEDPALAARNPMCVLAPGELGVKPLTKQLVDNAAQELAARTGFRLWHTLDLVNYQCSDAVRAFAEHAELPQAPGVTRTHAHAVSSAFGLLGHHFGTTLLPGSPAAPQYFLVQHMATPDMVLSLYGATPPEYRFDPATGLYHQHKDPRYPATTFDPAENLEPTFYTRRPATSPAMNQLIRTHGGGGVVVSLYECLSRYAEIRALLAGTAVDLPADPRELREWSLVMALTGALTGMERGLLDTDEVVVHGSGSYGVQDFTPIPDGRLRGIADAEQLRQVVFAAANARTP